MGGFLRFVLVVVVLASFLLSGCDVLFGPSGVSAGDPYDADCNLKPEYHKEWRKYSDFSADIPLESKSVQARQYYESVDRIAAVTAEIYTLERDSEVEELMKQELITYRTALVKGHKQNLVKSFLRLSLYTADVTWQNAVAGKQYGQLLSSTSKTGIQLVGEGVKLINSYAPSDSVIALDTKTVEGQVNDVARAGWMETVANIGEADASKVPLEMAKKATRYVMETPDPKLSDEEVSILKQEHLELKRVDSLIQDANKRNFDRLWQVRSLKQEKTNLENSLFDLEYDEKERVDAMLIGECQRKTGEDDGGGLFGFLFGGGDG